MRTHGSTDRLESYLGEWVQIKWKQVAITPTTHDLWPGKDKESTQTPITLHEQVRRQESLIHYLPLPALSRA